MHETGSTPLCQILTKMPANKRLKHSNNSSFYSQIDILIQIFSLLDAPEIIRISKCCRLWFRLVNAYESILYKQMTVRKFRLCSEDLHNKSWKNLYRIHQNYFDDRYGFVRGETSFKINADFKVVDWDLPKPPSKKVPLAVWPVESLKAYLVALEGNLICWLDISDLSCILVAKWDAQENFIIKHEQKLEGHSSQISLLLSNGRIYFNSR
jgi:F-box-like